MSVEFGEYLNDVIKAVCWKYGVHSDKDVEDTFLEGIMLKNGDGVERNLRDAFRKFEEAHWNGHTGATRELAECYLHGRGCEIDLIKAAELGDWRLKLEVAKKMGGKEE